MTLIRWGSNLYFIVPFYWACLGANALFVLLTQKGGNKQGHYSKKWAWLHVQVNLSAKQEYSTIYNTRYYFIKKFPGAWEERKKHVSGTNTCILLYFESIFDMTKKNFTPILFFSKDLRFEPFWQEDFWAFKEPPEHPFHNVML